MKIIKENKFSNIFPMQIKCKRVVDCYGFSYGQEKDFVAVNLKLLQRILRNINGLSIQTMKVLTMVLSVLSVENLSL